MQQKVMLQPDHRRPTSSGFCQQQAHADCQELWWVPATPLPFTPHATATAGCCTLAGRRSWTVMYSPSVVWMVAPVVMLMV